MKNKLLFWENNNSIRLLNKSLNSGQVIAASCDTVLGLLASVSEKSLMALNNIKHRDTKPYIVLIDTFEKLNLYAQINFNNKKLIQLINNCWPGPLTLVFRLKTLAPKFLINLDKTIAIRIPRHQYLLQLLTNFDGLFSTSANISGNPIPEYLNQLNSNIVNAVEYIVVNEFKENDRYPIIPSTILDCTTDKIKVIREGAYPLSDLEKYLD